MFIRNRLLSSTAVLSPPNEGAGGSDGGELPELELGEEGEEGDGEEGNGAEEGAEDGDSEGDEGDDNEGEQDGEDAGDEGEQPAPRRGDRSVGALRADRRRLAEENATLTRQLDELRRNPPQNQQQPIQETPAQRAERFALMSPAEQAQAVVDEALGRHAAQTNAVMRQLSDNSDKMSFEAVAAVNPLARKLQPDVERRLADLRSRNQDLPRQVVLTYLLGERLLAQQGKGKKPAAQQRREAERVRVPRGGSDVQADRGGRRGGNNSIEAMERAIGDRNI